MLRSKPFPLSVLSVPEGLIENTLLSYRSEQQRQEVADFHLFVHLHISEYSTAQLRDRDRGCPAESTTLWLCLTPHFKGLPMRGLLS